MLFVCDNVLYHTLDDRAGDSIPIRKATDQKPDLMGLRDRALICLMAYSFARVGAVRPLVRTDAADMLKRRLKQAGLPAHYSPHSFRATGITNFLENDGTLEAAQRIAWPRRQPHHETL